MTDIYSRFESFVRKCIEARNIATIKYHDDFRYMLEHVSRSTGEAYLKLLEQTPISKERIRQFCAANDAIGCPKQESLSIGRYSPTSVRYLYHAHLALTHFQRFASAAVSIVEVGGGYGGLCAAISFIRDLYTVKIDSYSIVDLPTIGQLQKMMLEHWTLGFPVSFHSADTFGATVEGSGLYLISNYCFSELPRELQEKYRATLFPRVAHGFLAWNMIPVYPLGYPSQAAEPEQPLTGTGNQYVRF